jgi:hypothetical protein
MYLPLPLTFPTPTKRGLNIKVPRDFATPQDALDFLRGSIVADVTVDIAAGTYEQSLIIRDIYALGNPPLDIGDVAYDASRHGLAIRMDGYTDRVAPAVTVQRITSQVRNVAVCGIRANLNGMATNLNWGFAASGGASLFAYDCLADNAGGVNLSNNFGIGFGAYSGGFLRAYRATARNCQNGFQSLRNSRLFAPAAVAEFNKAYQYAANDLSLLLASNSQARGPSGYWSDLGSHLIADASTFTGTLPASSFGFYATNGSRLNCNNAVATGGFLGAYGYLGSYVVANGMRSTGNAYGFYAHSSGTVACTSAIVQNASAVGYFAANDGRIHAVSTVATNSGNATNYSPATSGTPGNSNAVIIYS